LAPLLYLEALEWQSFNNLRSGGQVPRPMTLYIRQVMGGEDPLLGVEIGVEGGINAESILSILNLKRLYLVDPYEPFVTDNVQYAGRGREDAVKRLWKFRDQIQFIQRKSADAVDMVPTGLDFVYIDGNHQYEYAKKDIESYYPKIRLHGILGGHDFQRAWLGVIRAVTEFSVIHKAQLMVEGTDWWFTKIEAFEKSQ
jgi:hypothetical protein